MATRGIMADNMFLSKSELLGWLNSTLRLKVEKVEETCNGAVACQLMDILHPGTVNMKRVDWNARSEYEMINNYKELQQSFTKNGIDRAFNVNQLVKGKPQDNTEFMQWFKGYWDSVTGGQDFAAEYDAVARRLIAKTGDWKKCSLGEGASRPVFSNANKDGTIPAVRRGPPSSAPRSTMSSKHGARIATGGATSFKAAPALDTAAMNKLNARIAELTEHVTELKLKVETAERERDFYFDKLRDIEILCQAPELVGIPVLRTVEKVLYAADTEEAKSVMLEAQEQYNAQLVVGEDVPEEQAEPAVVDP